ncbi:DEAD/DEAH box helicase [Massilia sp. HP4]|uniref:DEAD/DEAH box helicase n=1 Tax=Massilia sp. HP4 TaxID=2562316 RepID=UPI0010C0A5CD|nr:AAA domain-containing protein [Massilia sp. HP4]
MVPALAVGAAVALGAAALAFFLDRDTEEERALHAELRRRNAGLRSRYDSRAAEHARERAERRRRAALERADNLREYCLRYERRLDEPALEFRKLGQSLKAELADRSISPYRRNALRGLQARLEATVNRLDAFLAYCRWYRSQLDHLLAKERHEALLGFDEPSSRLPEDWYYHGKVGLVPIAELANVPNRYFQHLALRTAASGADFNDTRQRALAMQYPDQDAVPVQLFKSNNPRYFKACILRGAMYVEHVIEKLPCPAIVVGMRSNKDHGDVYEIRCFPAFCEPGPGQEIDNGVRAFLPRSETAFPGKRYPAGERIEVFLHQYDLCMSGSSVTVTQHRESLAVAGSGSAPVFVHADQGVLDLHPLIAELARGADWKLRSTTESRAGIQVDLQVGEWQVLAEVCHDASQLRIDALARQPIDSTQLDQLPFAMRLVDARFKNSVFCDRLRFDQFVQFCRQQALFGQDSEARRKAAGFFDRWSEVIDYLLEEDGYQTFPLESISAPDNREWDCACAGDLASAVRRHFDKSAYSAPIFIEEQYRDRAGEPRWLRIGELTGIPDKVEPNTYRLPHRGIERAAVAHGYETVPEAPLRLRLPNGGELANLTRQKRTLQTFMGGRLVNRALQQILLMPERYTPQPDAFWSARVASGLNWSNPDWIAPGQAQIAKRVIEEALVESNLYLIQGPPGTGKTTCIVELLHQLFDADPEMRVLVVSQQNTAVDNALDRFLRHHPDRRANVLRIGNDPSKVESSLQPHLTDAILTEYLGERQREYSLATIEKSGRAAWLADWMESVHRQDARGQSRFDDELAELLVGDYGLVGATCVGLGSRRYGMDRLVFDVCIVDEGGRSTVPELLIPLMRSRKAILIGDHHQLPPSVASSLRDGDVREVLPFLEDTFLKTSFFEQLYDNLPTACRGRLQVQYRMVEPIGDLVADLFYSHDGQRGLSNGKVHDRSGFLDPEYPLRWHNVEGRQEKERDGGTSLLNVAEAKSILHFLKVAARRLAIMRSQPGASIGKKTVAVITPYGAQKRLILGMLAAARDEGLEDVMSIEVDTVDSFQGSEAHLVLYSTVRTAGSISFLLDRQRLNVACSRARENLVFFGATRFLRKCEARRTERLFSTIMERSKYEPGSQADTRPSRQDRQRSVARAA